MSSGQVFHIPMSQCKLCGEKAQLVYQMQSLKQKVGQALQKKANYMKQWDGLQLNEEAQQYINRLNGYAKAGLDTLEQKQKDVQAARKDMNSKICRTCYQSALKGFQLPPAPWMNQTLQQLREDQSRSPSMSPQEAIERRQREDQDLLSGLPSVPDTKEPSPTTLDIYLPDFENEDACQMCETAKLKKDDLRMLKDIPPEQWPLYWKMCDQCLAHQATRPTNLKNYETVRRILQLNILKRVQSNPILLKAYREWFRENTTHS